MCGRAGFTRFSGDMPPLFLVGQCMNFGNSALNEDWLCFGLSEDTAEEVFFSVLFVLLFARRQPQENVEWHPIWSQERIVHTHIELL